MINKTNYSVVLVDEETGKKYFLVICDIEGDKKNQAVTTGMQLVDIISNASEQTETCNIELTYKGSTASIENIIEKHSKNCKPKPQAESPLKFTPRCMQICYYLFVKKWTPKQIAELFKCSIPNIDNLKKLCFDEAGLADKDRTTAKLGAIWMHYYADWVDTEKHEE